MTVITGTSIYTSKIKNLQGQIAKINKELKTGTKVLTKDEQSTVTKLSTEATSFAPASTSLTAAQSVITSAQNGLTKIKPLLAQLQVLANQGTNPTLSNLDAVDLNRRYQNIITDIGKSYISLINGLYGSSSARDYV